MTIYHKTMLAGAVQVAKVDGDPVRLCGDGAVVATCRWGTYVAQPTRAEVVKALPLQPTGGRSGMVQLSADVLATWLKGVPADRQFNGLLEHVDLSPVLENGAYDGRLTARSHDGRVLSESLLRGRYVENALDYRDHLQRLKITDAGKPLSLGTFVFNRKRLGVVMSAIEAACKYDGEFALIWQYPFTADPGAGGYLWRSFNELTGQSVLFTFSLPAVERALRWTPWEEDMLGVGAVKKPVTLRRKV
jgi:hypothetical protein